MTECNQQTFRFASIGSRKVEASFRGAEVSSEGGLLLLQRMDRRLNLTRRLADKLHEDRDPDKLRHSLQQLLQQRIYGICAGYEDLNDQNSLRQDVLWQTVTGRTEALAGASTLCRLENRSDRRTASAMHEVLVEQFVDSFKKAPRKLILDFDATDDRVHGNQQGRFFHGYYGDWCFLPLYVFCGEQLLVSYLRRSNIDAAKHAWAILSLLVKRFRASWPEVKIIVRGDSGFCRWKMLRWCERHQVGYIIGLARNKRLESLSRPAAQQAQRQWEQLQSKQRLFGWLEYKASSWDKKRHVIHKAEHTSQGANPRYVVTNLPGEAQALYDELYCGRGEMENRIKEQQLGLFADRTSCHGWWANQFRLLLSSFAYTLMEAIRRIGLHGTEWAHAQVSTLRLKLIKIGAVLLRNTRRVQVLLTHAYPYQSLFALVYQRSAPG